MSNIEYRMPNVELTRRFRPVSRISRVFGAEKMLRVLLVVSILLFAASSFAGPSGVSIHSSVDRSAITVGDPVQYSLTVRRGEQDTVEAPPLGLHLGQFEIRDYRRLDARRTKEGWVEETTEYLITAYKTGEYEIPPVPVRFVTEDGDTGQIRSEPISIQIESVKPSEAKDIHDIKAPVAIAGGIPLWAAIVGGAVLVGFGAGLFLYLRHRKRSVELRSAPQEPIDELGEFDKIAALGLLDQGQYKRHYILLSEALRRYIERRYGVDAMERTTYEISEAFRSVDVEEDHLVQIEGFLSECDLVKFAKYIPPMEVMAGAVERAKRVVETTQVVEEPAPVAEEELVEEEQVA